MRIAPPAGGGGGGGSDTDDDDDSGGSTGGSDGPRGPGGAPSFPGTPGDRGGGPGDSDDSGSSGGDSGGSDDDEEIDWSDITIPDPDEDPRWETQGKARIRVDRYSRRHSKVDPDDHNVYLVNTVTGEKRGAGASIVIGDSPATTYQKFHPAGTYRVVAERGNSTATQTIQVEAGEVTRATLKPNRPGDDDGTTRGGDGPTVPSGGGGGGSSSGGGGGGAVTGGGESSDGGGSSGGSGGDADPQPFAQSLVNITNCSVQSSSVTVGEAVDVSVTVQNGNREAATFGVAVEFTNRRRPGASGLSVGSGATETFTVSATPRYPGELEVEVDLENVRPL